MDIKIIALFVVISIAAIIYLTTRIRLKAFIALFIVSIFLAFTTLPASKVLSTIKEGFGGTMASIGFLIIFGAIIGITLDRTRATYSMANWILSKTGQSRSTVALGITGFITGLPIFCDSGFIVLSGLARSFSIKSGVVMPLMATILATSLYSVHCLIPPHPGATAAAGIIGTDLSTLILAGILFAIPGAVAAFFWSRFMVKGKKYEPAKRRADDVASKENDLPGVLVSFLPVVVPLLLITLKSIAGIIDKDGSGLIYRLLNFPGEPVFALFIGVILSLLLIKDKSIESFNSVFSEAIEKAGPILIVTAAGGMFGMVIKATGIGEEMGKLFAGMGIGLLVPFLISAILKTAQGSSTVAIITAASFIGPMLSGLGLDSEMGKLLALLSMGAGSMLVSHANDSYFWVITNFSEIEVDATLRVYSSSTIVMGITVFICIYVSSFILL
jgi:gluconate:H+ symporter, GntP family